MYKSFQQHNEMCFLSLQQRVPMVQNYQHVTKTGSLKVNTYEFYNFVYFKQAIDWSNIIKSQNFSNCLRCCFNFNKSICRNPGRPFWVQKEKRHDNGKNFLLKETSDNFWVIFFSTSHDRLWYPSQFKKDRRWRMQRIHC